MTTSNFIYKKKRIKKTSDILQTTFKRLRCKNKLGQYEWFLRWEEIVGREISEVAYPERIKNGRVLIVKVLDIAWVQELSLRKDEILDKLYKSSIGVSIEDLHFITDNPKDFKRK